MKQKGSLDNSKPVLMIAGFVVLVVWFEAIVSFQTLSFLGFSVPEILISQEFLLSAVGFSILYNTLEGGKRRTERKADLAPFIGYLIAGTCIVLTFGLSIKPETPNFFAYLGLVIGAAIIFLDAKQLHAHLADSRKTLETNK
ncbi:MAG: hypothetical protein ACLFU9_00390 [Candidatus Bathyarchaeia archaeon]